MEAGSALVVPGSAIDGEAPGSDDDEAASPRVRLTQARLLDGRLQNQTVEDGSVTEELGNLMVNDAFDMLIRKNDESNDDTLRDMDSAINDLKKWREIRNRDLALELEGMRPPAELGVPETDDEFPTESCISRTDCYEEDKKADFRRADDKAIESLGLLMRSPRSQSDGGDKEAQRRQEDAEAKEDGVREMLERQAQKITFSQIEHQVREQNFDEASLRLQLELLEMEMAAEAGMGALSSQLKGFESELDSFLERTK